MSRLNVWPWLRPLLILTVVISIPPLVYWFGYVQSSVTAARQQAHATLSAVGVELKERLAAHEQIAVSAERAVGSFDVMLKSFNVPNTNQRDAEMKRFANSYLRGVLPSKAEPEGVCSKTGHFDHLAPNADSGRLNLHVGRFRIDDKDCSTRVSLPFENLVAWDLVAADFDGLLVLDEKGSLLAQDRRLPAQPLGIPIVLQSAPPAASTPGPERQSLNPFDFSRDHRLELAGERYLVFTQSIRVTVASAGSAIGAVEATSEPLTLRVYGLMREERLRSDAIALSPQTLVMIGSLVALGLFAIPFLKLRFIGPRERLRTRDVWWLGASLLCASALLVLLIMNANAHSVIRQRFDAALQEFVASIRKQLRAEADAAFSQLQASAPELLSLKQDSPVDGVGSWDGALLSSSRTFTYPDFEAMYAVDLAGQQTHKWMPRTQPTGRSNVADRDYFQRGLTLRTDGPQYYFDTVVARTTGKLGGFYATPFGGTPTVASAETQPTSRRGVMILSSPIRAVNDAVVAQPFQFVMVDRGGRVSFHRAQGPYTGERFFDSVRGGATLDKFSRAAGREDKPLLPTTYQYRGQQYRMTAVHLPELQSTIVGYYDQSVTNRMAARSFGVAAAGAFGIILLSLLGAALALCCRAARAQDWFYPARDRTAVYVAGCCASALYMAIAWIMRELVGGVTLAWFLALMPLALVAALGSGVSIATLTKLASKTRLDALCTRWLASPAGNATAFKAAAVMIVLSLVAWPTLIIFDDALTVQAHAYSKAVANDWQQERDRRRARLVAVAVKTGAAQKSPHCEKADNDSADPRCALPDRLYATDTNYKTLTNYWSSVGVYGACTDLLTAMSCDLSRSDAAPRQFSGMTALLATWLARPRADGQQFEYHVGALLEERPKGWPPRLLGWTHWWSWILPAFVFLIAFMALLVGSITKHVLGIEVLSDPLPDASLPFAPNDGTRWLLLRPRAATLGKFVQPQQTLDLHDVSLTPQSLQSPAAGARLLVQHIDHRLADVEWRNALLRVFQARTGCVVATSEIDPLYYLTQRLHELEAATDTKQAEAQQLKLDEARKELQAWSAAFQGVHKVREPARSESKPLQGAATFRQAVEAECSANEPLLEIGRRLLTSIEGRAHRPEQVPDLVLDVAEPYYRSLWELCSREEQLVLIQLAEEGLINPKRLELVRRLARRGLIVIAPHVRLMNESFTRFVRAVEPPERVAQWEHMNSGVSWSRFGTPLYALAAVVIAILLFTQQDMFSNILGVVTAAGGTLGSLRNLYMANVKPIVSVVKPA